MNSWLRACSRAAAAPRSKERLYFEEVDDALAARLPLIKYIFKKYTGKFALPTDLKAMMSLDEWMTFLSDVRAPQCGQWPLRNS